MSQDIRRTREAHTLQGRVSPLQTNKNLLGNRCNCYVRSWHYHSERLRILKNTFVEHKLEGRGRAEGTGVRERTSVYFIHPPIHPSVHPRRFYNFLCPGWCHVLRKLKRLRRQGLLVPRRSLISAGCLLWEHGRRLVIELRS